jgi:ubiquinone/menaquinone biosynthesis C-methylase UbiE
MDKKAFKDFFEPYSKNVDSADSLHFWKLSDALVLEIIKQNIPTDLGNDKTIMDAGGGTGRWVAKLCKEYKSNFIIYDLSEDMLAQAEKNVKEKGIENRVKLIHGDLCNMQQMETGSVDYIVSIYSPISFVYENEKAAGELFRVLKPGGRIIIMGHGYYNALASKINNYVAPAKELSRLNDNELVAWAPYVPELVTYSKESMERLLENVGFSIVSTYGVPVFVQPGPEDFDPENKERSRISIALSNQDFFDKVFEIEMQHNSKSHVANRGMNIFTVAEKL